MSSRAGCFCAAAAMDRDRDRVSQNNCEETSGRFLVINSVVGYQCLPEDRSQRVVFNTSHRCH